MSCPMYCGWHCVSRKVHLSDYSLISNQSRKLGKMAENNRPMGGNTQNFEDKEDLESIQSDVFDMSEDLEDVISPLADPYGTTNLERRICFRRSRKREIDQLGQQSGSLPRLRSGRI